MTGPDAPAPDPYRSAPKPYGPLPPGVAADGLGAAWHRTPPPPRGLSIASMVIGIVSVVFAWIAFFVPVVSAVVPITGLVLGIVGISREPAGRGFAVAGVWINALVLGLSLLVLVAVLALIAVGLVSFPFDGPVEEPPNA